MILQGVFSLLTRGWQANGKVEEEEAMRAIPFGGVYAAFEDVEKGSLEEGKLAVFSACTEDLFCASLQDLVDVMIGITLVGGRLCMRDHNKEAQMNRRHLIIFGLALGLALAVGVVYAARADSARPAPRVVALMPQADGSWSSGWVDIAQSETLTFTHSLGGDPDLYGVELWFLDTATPGFGINNRGIGGLDVAGQRSGAYWSHLTASSVRVTRNASDVYADRVRLRVWQPDPPDWDSGWQDIQTGEANMLTLIHNLGGNVDDYQVGIKFHDTSSNGLGTHLFAVGGMESAGAFHGAAWRNLTDSSIRVIRSGGDETADQVRVTISRSDDPPDFDSGWVSVNLDQTEVITHALGGNFNAYVVRASQRSDSQEYGINIMGAGGFEVGNLYRGSNLQRLNDSTVSIYRHPNDLFADDVRVRIWVPQALYLPIVMRDALTTAELAYDDGEADSSQTHNLDSGFAVRFTTPATSARLLRARFYLLAATGTHPIEVHVWDSTHSNDLITPFQVTPPAGDGWYDVTLPISPTVSGDFYVGFLYAGTESFHDPSLGVDTDPPLDDRSYEVPWIAFANDYMIRVVVQGVPSK